jgi:hypothetical protein
MTASPTLVWRTVLEPRPDVSGRLKVAIVPAESTIAWQLGWERETRVGFTDAETGTLLGYRRKQLIRHPRPRPGAPAPLERGGAPFQGPHGHPT